MTSLSHIQYQSVFCTVNVYDTSSVFESDELEAHFFFFLFFGGPWSELLEESESESELEEDEEEEEEGLELSSLSLLLSSDEDEELEESLLSEEESLEELDESLLLLLELEEDLKENSMCCKCYFIPQWHKSAFVHHMWHRSAVMSAVWTTKKELKIWHFPLLFCTSFMWKYICA